MEKKLYRCRNDKKIAGVCSGIAKYFNIDSSIVRLAAVLLVIAGGSGVLAYIIAAIIIPEEPEISYEDYKESMDEENY